MVLPPAQTAAMMELTSPEWSGETIPGNARPGTEGNEGKRGPCRRLVTARDLRVSRFWVCGWHLADFW